MAYGLSGRQLNTQRTESGSNYPGLTVRQPCAPQPSRASCQEQTQPRWSRRHWQHKSLRQQRQIVCYALECDRSADVVDPPTFVSAPGRIVAIGDIHGDLQKTFAALSMAGVYREGSNREPIWCGGNTTIVQLGDVLDRGDHEIGVIMLLRELDRQARKEGGAVYMLNGNHESLNVSGNYRYVTPLGLLESAVAAGLTGVQLEQRHLQIHARTKMFAPGQPMAMELAKNPTVLIVNNTLFAHGGVLPCHVTYGLQRINAEVAAWMRGDRCPAGKYAQPPFLAMGNADSVMWNRSFGRELAQPFERYCMCQQLRTTLAMLGVKRLVVGHTPQLQGANCVCNGQVWRVDVGMSGGVLNANPQVLEIVQQADGNPLVRLLTAPTLPALNGANHSLPCMNSLAFSPRQIGQVAR